MYSTEDVGHLKGKNVYIVLLDAGFPLFGKVIGLTFKDYSLASLTIVHSKDSGSWSFPSLRDKDVEMIVNADTIKVIWQDPEGQDA